MTIYIYITNHYGNLTLYPADENAAAFLSITGRRTFRPSDLARARDLGIQVEIEGHPDDVTFAEHAIASDADLWVRRRKERSLEPANLTPPKDGAKDG